MPYAIRCLVHLRECFVLNRYMHHSNCFKTSSYAPEDRKGSAFGLTSASGRTIVMEAASEAVRYQWVEALAQVSESRCHRCGDPGGRSFTPSAYLCLQFGAVDGGLVDKGSPRAANSPRRVKSATSN